MSSRRIEGIDGAGAAAVVEEFARMIARSPGVWAVTVKRCLLRKSTFELHLVVHAECDGAELLPSTGWWR